MRRIQGLMPTRAVQSTPEQASHQTRCPNRRRKGSKLEQDRSPRANSSALEVQEVGRPNWLVGLNLHLRLSPCRSGHLSRARQNQQQLGQRRHRNLHHSLLQILQRRINVPLHPALHGDLLPLLLPRRRHRRNRQPRPCTISPATNRTNCRSDQESLWRLCLGKETVSHRFTHIRHSLIEQDGGYV